MAGKLSGNAIENGTVTTAQLAADVSAVIAQGGGPKVTSIAYPNNALAADNTGNSVVIVTGTGFNPGVTVYVNGVISSTVTRANANSLSFTVPANTQGTTVPFHVINTDGGSTIYFPGITISGTPTWLTGSDLGVVSPNTDISLAPLFAYNPGDITPIYATGGTVANINNYTIHTFTSTSSFNVSFGGGQVEYLIVAAGGGGGNDMGGGGGGGGVLANTVNVTVSNYTITIGAGGAGGTGYASSPPAGANGGNTSFANTIIAVGGGGGGSGHRTDAPYTGADSNARIGGSGGGSAARYRYSGAPQSLGANSINIPSWQRGTRGGHSPETQVSDQYYAGGGGGGGGNTALAGMANGSIDAVSGTRAGHGGDGYLSNISGTSYYYAGGGGGGSHTAGQAGKGGFGGGGGGSTWPGGTAGIGGRGGTANGADGVAGTGGAAANNTGGGGGGGGHQAVGGAGGSGIVYIRYPKNDTVVSNMTYTLVSGSLPPGLNLSANGVITGNVTTPPNASTTYSFTVKAGPDPELQYSEKTFSLTVLNPSLRANGGTITYSGNYKIHTFTSSGSFVVEANPNSLNVEYLIVAGGGGGGGWGGGGGGGGVVTGSGFIPTANTTYTVTIGAGGARGSGPSYTQGGDGANSSFPSITTAVGGGGGGNYNGGAARTGGSGGGGGMGESSSGPGAAGTPGQGNAGGAGGTNVGNWNGGRGGGGGGAGEAGYSGVGPLVANTGRGGAGLVSTISGTSSFYAGGGGGHSGYAPQLSIGGAGGGGAGGRHGPSNPNGVPGIAAIDGSTNTGGGGGGAWGGSGELCGTGGSGMVILRYLIT